MTFLIYIFMLILFHLSFLFFERNGLDSLLCAFFPHRILIDINILFSLDVFSFDRINLYIKLFIEIVFILEHIFVSLGVFLS